MVRALAFRWITDAGKADGIGPDFSRKIRESIPKPE
jgi:hypothetical protein